MAVACRMLGSLAEAEDAVPESWVRLSRGDAGTVANGEVGVVVGSGDRMMLAMRPAIEDGRIVEVEVLADPESIRDLEVVTLDP